MSPKVVLFVALVALVCISGALAGSSRKHAISSVGVRPTGLDMDCPLCIDFMVDAINVYLNEWLQITLPNDCTQLCAKVDPAHNSTCNLMCNAYGIYEFIKVISKVDIDPIYMCQLQKQCPIQDCATPSCAEIVSINLKPQPVKRGDTLTVTGIYRVSGNAGAGMLRLMSETQADGGWTKGPTDYLVSSYKPGEYKAVYEIDTSNLQPGLWKTTFYVCQGECGSKWPHSKLFSKHTVEWTMPN